MSRTVFVVDDDYAVRDSLARLLTHEGFSVRAFASAEAFLEQCPVGQHGCAVLDVLMPGLTGTELQEALRARQDDLPIIFLTGHADVSLAVKTLKAGAYDFLEKPVDAGILIESVRRALELEAKHHAAKSAALAARTRLKDLTPRERQMLPELAAGLSSKEIARRLGISYRTVEVHRSNVLHKTDARNVAELARLADAATRDGSNGYTDRRDKPKVANSVFVCCRTPDTKDGHRDAIAETVRGLGRAARVFPCCWYLETPLDISNVKLQLAPKLSETDTLVVVDATNRQAAWRNIEQNAADLIVETWPSTSLPSDLQRVAAKGNTRSSPTANRR